MYICRKKYRYLSSTGTKYFLIVICRINAMFAVTCSVPAMIDCTWVTPLCPTVPLGATCFNLASLLPPPTVNVVQRPDVRCHPPGNASQRHTVSGLWQSACLSSLAATVHFQHSAELVKLLSRSNLNYTLQVTADRPDATRAGLNIVVFMGQTGGALNLQV